MVKSIHSRISETYRTTGIQWNVIERDYLLSWVLAGISQVPALNDTLVFKGGTALRKCYFGDYRFSEDLDFTGLHGAPAGDGMEDAMKEACDVATNLLKKESGSANVDIACERYVEKRPHPGNQEAFRIRARLPWHNYPLTGTKTEITMDEKILRPVKKRKIIFLYGESLEVEIKTYSLEEIVAEKLRAILQNVDKLKKSNRGWIRPRGRDYYDLWRILSEYRDDMDLAEFSSFLRNKCAARYVTFTDPEDFFDEAVLALVDKAWDRSLGLLTSDLPSCSSVIGELREQIKALLFSS